MKMSDIIRRAGRNLRQAKGRTLLTALAISVGAFTITLALAAGTGGKEYTDTLIKNNGDSKSITVVAKAERQSDAPKKYDADGPSSSSIGILSDKDVERVKSVSGVHEVTPMYTVSAEYVTGPNGDKYQAPLTIKADQTSMELEAGSLDNSQIPKGKIVISESFVKPLGFKDAKNAISKSITLHLVRRDGASSESRDMKFEIAAVDKKSQTVIDYSSGVRLSVDDGKAIYDFETPNGSKAEYYGLTVQVSDNKDVEAVKNAIKDKGYDAYSLKDVQSIIFTFVNIVMGGAAGFGALAILASIFGIINTQYISVLERTQQIGLMKALGARSRDIGRLFRYEAAWVGLLGGVIGTGFALLVGLLNPWITGQLDLEQGTKLLIFKPLYSVILIVALMLVAVIAGWFPSRKAAKLDPIEALRTE